MEAAGDEDEDWLLVRNAVTWQRRGDDGGGGCRRAAAASAASLVDLGVGSPRERLAQALELLAPAARSSGAATSFVAQLAVSALDVLRGAARPTKPALVAHALASFASPALWRLAAPTGAHSSSLVALAVAALALADAASRFPPAACIQLEAARLLLSCVRVCALGLVCGEGEPPPPSAASLRALLRASIHALPALCGVDAQSLLQLCTDRASHAVVVAAAAGPGVVHGGVLDELARAAYPTAPPCAAVAGGGSDDDSSSSSSEAVSGAHLQSAIAALAFTPALLDPFNVLDACSRVDDVAPTGSSSQPAPPSNMFDFARCLHAAACTSLRQAPAAGASGVRLSSSSATAASSTDTGVEVETARTRMRVSLPHVARLVAEAATVLLQTGPPDDAALDSDEVDASQHSNESTDDDGDGSEDRHRAERAHAARVLRLALVAVQETCILATSAAVAHGPFLDVQSWRGLADSQAAAPGEASSSQPHPMDVQLLEALCTLAVVSPAASQRETALRLLRLLLACYHGGPRLQLMAQLLASDPLPPPMAAALMDCLRAHVMAERRAGGGPGVAASNSMPAAAVQPSFDAAAVVRVVGHYTERRGVALAAAHPAVPLAHSLPQEQQQQQLAVELCEWACADHACVLLLRVLLPVCAAASPSSALAALHTGYVQPLAAAVAACEQSLRESLGLAAWTAHACPFPAGPPTPVADSRGGPEGAPSRSVGSSAVVATGDEALLAQLALLQAALDSLEHV